MSTHIRFIGDLHGNITENKNRRCYTNLINGIPYSVQLGDWGFDYRPLKNIDPIRNRVLPGNHDNYDDMINYPHFLGDFGWHSFPLKNNKEFKFFFIRGAFSIDRKWRIPTISWWEQEELTFEQCYKLIDVYREAKPDFVVSHDCPQNIMPYVVPGGYDRQFIQPSRTNQILQSCFEIHRPSTWIFAHHHRNWTDTVMGTKFFCLDGQTDRNEVGFLDFDDEGQLITLTPQ
jgi:hypothetical protein